MARRVPDGPPPPPVVQRIRIRYAKRGRLRFTSHRDFARAFERALRRAEVPMGYSAGFSPHPKISYANAAPTGTASEAEYVEVSVISRVDPAAVRLALDTALSPGLDILEVVEAGPGSLADRLQASHWRISLPGADPAVLAAAVEVFLAADEVPVQRLTKDGIRTFDARGAVARLAASSGTTELGTPCAILDAVVRHGTPTVRPDDVLSGLRRGVDLVPPAPPIAVRLAQGPFDEESGVVSDPFTTDREVVGALGLAGGV
jgi:radical SAM-linked protein